MNAAKIKEIQGKTIASAEVWPDDEGDVCLQLNFTDGTTFCMDVRRPRLSMTAQLWKENDKGGDITAKIMKRAQQ